MPKSESKKAAKRAARESLAPVVPLAVAPSKYAPTSWTGAENEANLHDVVVPSGQLIQIRHVGPAGLLTMGLLDNLDVLGSLVQTEHVDRVNGRKPKKLTAAEEKAKIDEQMREVLADPSKIAKAMQMMDTVTIGVVNQPKVHAVPVPRLPTPAETAANVELDEHGLYTPPRVKGLVYVDTVDVEDKAFILNYVMSATNELAEFREGLAENVAALESVQDVPKPAKRAAPRKRANSGVSPE